MSLVNKARKRLAGFLGARKPLLFPLKPKPTARTFRRQIPLRMGVTTPEPSLVPTGYWRTHVPSTEELQRIYGLPVSAMVKPLRK